MGKRILVLSVCVALLGVLLLEGYPRALEPAAIRDFILAFGIAAPVAYALLYALGVFIPYGTTLLSIAAGLAFGTARGALLTYGITIFASLLPVIVSRRFGRRRIEDKIGDTRLEKYANVINRNAFLTFFYLRLLPTIPYELQNYLAGLSRITYRRFWLATVLGDGPIILVMTFFGDTLTAPGSPAFWLAAGIFVAALLAPAVLAMITRRRRRRSQLARVLSP